MKRLLRAVLLRGVEFRVGDFLAPVIGTGVGFLHLTQESTSGFVLRRYAQRRADVAVLMFVHRRDDVHAVGKEAIAVLVKSRWTCARCS